ncbi:vanillate O-demethylase oxygenase subunit [Striga asiatica]|uniref:Vanillate O-demethylase oxygenase subunit n=1 Tax=Striga asiatica TaxID=4170 RepID=A0A5A7Q2L2_STRAF|nr:vanillate O-demethylase oxygenase subunit [Striga asiatica]
MSSGTVNFPAILVTVTCNPRRCVRTSLSGRERKDFSEQPDPGVNFPSERVTTTEDLPPTIGRPLSDKGVRRGSLLCLHTRLPFSESSAGPPTTSLRPGGVYCTKTPGRRLPKSPAQRMSDAKPRTSLRSYWHTLPKKKEQTPLKTRVRYNKARLH